MLKQVFQERIGSLLKDYVQNVSDSDVSLTDILKGDVNFRDLKLRNDCLDALQLPVQLKSGIIGKLHIVCDLTHIWRAPVKVTIDEVHLVLGPTKEFNHSEFLAGAARAKSEQLKQADAAEAMQREHEARRSSERGKTDKEAGSSLWGVIMDNIQ